jgi:hypothetical protein
MTKCPSCGEENPSGVGMCKRCGKQIPLEESPLPLDENPQGEVDSGSFEEQVLGLLRAGKKIEAIKIYRTKTGRDLKEAKDAVEALAKQNNIAAKGAGCASVLLIVAVTGLIIASIISRFV